MNRRAFVLELVRRFALSIAAVVALREAILPAIGRLFRRDEYATWNLGLIDSIECSSVHQLHSSVIPEWNAGVGVFAFHHSNARFPMSDNDYVYFGSA